MLCALSGVSPGRVRRNVYDVGASQINATELKNIVVEMRDIFIFLHSRIACFSEEDRIDADLSEINRLEEVYHEIADIQDYLHAQIQPYNNQFDSIQRKLLNLVEEARDPHRFHPLTGYKLQLNGTDDILLGCICLILNPSDFTSLDYECVVEDSDSLVNTVANAYALGKKGMSLPSVSLQDHFIRLQTASACGQIEDRHIQLIQETIAD